MKLTDLHKNQGLKIEGEARRGGIPDRYGRGTALVTDRKEQRKLDAAAGLVPFACKIHGDLVKEVTERAQAGGKGLNETVAELLKKGLAAKK
ncbi:MAG TPA: hypothetical protein PK042_03560 [Usitatibacteraceae bacterium]|nr:hypothetical protein [Usitatibacteraceae bacterium]